MVTWTASSERYAQLYQNNKHISFIIAPLSSGAMINQRCYHLRHDDQPTDTVRESMYHIVSDGNVHQLHLKLIMHLYALWFNERIFDDVLLGDFNKKHGKDLGRWWNDVVEWHKRQGINGIFIDESADASTTNLPWFHRSFGFPYSRNDTRVVNGQLQKQQSSFPCYLPKDQRRAPVGAAAPSLCKRCRSPHFDKQQNQNWYVHASIHHEEANNTYELELCGCLQQKGFKQHLSNPWNRNPRLCPLNTNSDDGRRHKKIIFITHQSTSQRLWDKDSMVIY